MTPYDAANVDSFMARGGGAAVFFVTRLAIGPGALVPASVHNLYSAFLHLTPWEQANVVYRLHDDVRALLTAQARRFTENARAADDRADAAVALAEEVF